MNEAGVSKYIILTTDMKNSGTLKFGIPDIDSEIVCSALSGFRVRIATFSQ
jgi:hypothetical protein